MPVLDSRLIKGVIIPLEELVDEELLEELLEDELDELLDEELLEDELDELLDEELLEDELDELLDEELLEDEPLPPAQPISMAELNVSKLICLASLKLGYFMLRFTIGYCYIKILVWFFVILFYI